MKLSEYSLSPAILIHKWQVYASRFTTTRQRLYDETRVTMHHCYV